MEQMDCFTKMEVMYHWALPDRAFKCGSNRSRVMKGCKGKKKKIKFSSFLCGWNSFCGVEKVRKCFTLLITGLAHRPQKFLPGFQTSVVFILRHFFFHAAQTNPKKALFWGGQGEGKNPALSPKAVGSSPNATSCSALPSLPAFCPKIFFEASRAQSILISEGVALSLRMPYLSLYLVLSLPFEGFESIW